MNADIQYQEWGRPRTVILSDSEARVLARHSYAVRCENRGGGRYHVGPVAGFVGSLRISAIRSVTVEPRLPLNSFAALLSLAYDEQVIPMRSDRAGASIGELSSWCAAQTVAEAQKLVGHALRRDYIAYEERRFTPRGRLVFSGESPRYDGALTCVTDEFLLDTEINRYVKAGLHQLATLDVARPWHAAIRGLVAEMSLVTSVRWSKKLPDWADRPLYREYRPLISLLQLIQQSRGSEFEAGPVSVSAFFFRLHELFEKAVYRALRRTAGAKMVVYQPALRNAAVHVSGAPDLGITFKPDVGLLKTPSVGIASADGKWKLVVDAKYRKPIEVGQYRRAFRNDNIYQIMAYSRMFGCPGLLVYPKVDQDIDISYRVGDMMIRIKTVDLMAADLDKEMACLATAAIG